MPDNSSNKGSVVMVGLWVLSILAVLAVNLGYRAQTSLKLAGSQRDTLKALFWARAGLSKAVYLLAEDAKSSETKDYDTVKACGVNLGEKEVKDIFSEKNENGGEGFDIGYVNVNKELIYGMRDEESRININGNTLFDKKKLFVLFGLRGVEAQGLRKLVDCVISWVDVKSAIPEAKKEDWAVAEELLLAFEYFYKDKGLTREDARVGAWEAFSKIQDIITINSNGKINLNTASADVLTVIFEALADAYGVIVIETDISDLVNKIVEFREQGHVFNTPGATGVKNDLNEKSVIISSGQGNIITTLFDKSLADIKSDNFRVEINGKAGKMNRKATVIVRREEPPRIIFYRYD